MPAISFASNAKTSHRERWGGATRYVTPKRLFSLHGNQLGVATRIERTSYDYNSMGIRVTAVHEIDANADGGYESTKTTTYLGDPQNFTGYAQTIREIEIDSNGDITKQTDYTFGTDEISQTVTENGNTTRTDVFGHDGHTSVRLLLDAAGAILTLSGIEQLYHYDAYGHLLNIQADQAGTNLLYSGESFDARIGQQYLRARWYDAATGRFNRLDPFFGNQNDPQSFHKYAYAHSDSVNGSDPSGMMSALAVAVSVGIITGVIGAVTVGTYFHITGRPVIAGIGIGFAAGFGLGFAVAGGIPALAAALPGLFASLGVGAVWSARLAKIAVSIGAYAAVASMYQFVRRSGIPGVLPPSDPAPASTKTEWTYDSLKSRIQEMPLPPGATQTDRIIAIQSMSRLLDIHKRSLASGYDNQAEDAANAYACHGFCNNILKEWSNSENAVPNGASANTRTSRVPFFKVFKTVYPRAGGQFSGNDNDHGTILIKFADGSEAHLDNGWFTFTGGLPEGTTVYGEANIPANYHRDPGMLEY